MKNNLFFILFKTLISFILVAYLIDLAYTAIYRNSKPRNKFQYVLKSSNRKYDVVFLGSSRVANHIDITLFDSISNLKSINLGIEGAGLNENLLLLKLLLNSNIKFKKIFIQIDRNFEVEETTIISLSQVMPFIDNNIIKVHLKQNLKNFNKLYYLPFYRYAVNGHKIGFRETFLTLTNRNPTINLENGYTPKFGNNIDNLEPAFPQKPREKNVIYNEIVSICEKNNIELITFISPYCSKVNNRKYIHELKIKIPNIIDLSKGYNDSYFFNCGHLNDEGAKLFTIDLFNESIKKIKN